MSRKVSPEKWPHQNTLPATARSHMSFYSPHPHVIGGSHLCSPPPMNKELVFQGRKVAVVTGASTCVGFGIARALCRQYNGDVILTARDEIRGQRATADLMMEGLDPTFHQLDVTDKASIGRLTQFLMNSYGGLDLLVNNAAVWPEIHSSHLTVEEAEATIRVNYTGTRNVTTALLPLLRPHARVVNISSALSMSALLHCSSELKAKLSDYEKLTLKEVDELIAQFLHDVRRGEPQRRGWPDVDHLVYSVSKIGVSLQAFLLHRDLATDPRADLVIVPCCPGFVSEKIPGEKDMKTINEGADTPVFCSFLPMHQQVPNGYLYIDRKPYRWEEGFEVPPEMIDRLRPHSRGGAI